MRTSVWPRFAVTPTVHGRFRRVTYPPTERSANRPLRAGLTDSNTIKDRRAAFPQRTSNAMFSFYYTRGSGRAGDCQADTGWWPSLAPPAAGRHDRDSSPQNFSGRSFSARRVCDAFRERRALIDSSREDRPGAPAVHACDRARAVPSRVTLAGQVRQESSHHGLEFRLDQKNVQMEGNRRRENASDRQATFQAGCIKYTHVEQNVSRVASSLEVDGPARSADWGLGFASSAGSAGGLCG